MKKTHPLKIKLVGGTYDWCSCGLTKTEGICDGSHRKTNKLPVEFSLIEDKEVAICNCGKTKTPPYCDGSHLK
jgi:CDGSH-type Zn-finger protein